jgi:signal peptidase I
MSNPKQKSVVREWIESILIALLLAAFIRTYFIQPFKIPSGSMRMTLVEGDRLFVNKLRYGPKLLPELFAVRQRESLHIPKSLAEARLPGLSSPKRGDIIVFVFPQDHKRDFIKRLIAFGGETVEIKEGKIFVDGQMTPIPGAENIYYYNERGSLYGRPGQRVVIPAGHYFVLGDNSKSSQDSRYWGFVPKDFVIGRAEFIFWPLSRVRVIK